MNPFRAIMTMINGMMSIFIKDWATGNPEAMYEGIIQDKLRERDKLKAAVGRVIGQKNRTAQTYATKSAQLVTCERRLKGALLSNNQAVGALALAQKAELEKECADLKAQLEEYTQDSEELKADVVRFSTSILEIKRKSASKIARLRAVEARAKIRGMLDELTTDTNNQLLQALDEKIEARIGEAEVDNEMDKVTNIERQIEREEAKAEQTGFEAEFIEMQRQFQAQQGTHAAQTPPPDGGGKQV